MPRRNAEAREKRVARHPLAEVVVPKGGRMRLPEILCVTGDYNRVRENLHTNVKYLYEYKQIFIYLMLNNVQYQISTQISTKLTYMIREFGWRCIFAYEIVPAHINIAFKTQTVPVIVKKHIG